MEKKISPLDNLIDFREFLHRIISNWYYFLLSIILSLAIAFGYIRYSHEQYKSTIKVIIKKSGDSESASEILYNNITDNKSSIKDEPILVKNSEGKKIGVITQADLLKAVVEGGDGE